LGISNVVTSKDTESLKEWFVGESTLEARSGILYQAIQNYEGTNLAVCVAILPDIVISLTP